MLEAGCGLGELFFKIIFLLQYLYMLTEKAWKIEKHRGKEKTIIHYFQSPGITAFNISISFQAFFHSFSFTVQSYGSPLHIYYFYSDLKLI